ncbi:MAG: hypothetical protein ABR538_01635 [Candidatus Binatia bacterium]
MKRALRLSGLSASLLAMFLASGGHWMVLQSVAWTKMFLDNVRTDTLVTAIDRTFDREHACSMCHQIQAGRDKERQPSAIASSDPSPRQWMAVPSFPCGDPSRDSRALAVALPVRPADFISVPPDPPPRTA